MRKKGLRSKCVLTTSLSRRYMQQSCKCERGKTDTGKREGGAGTLGRWFLLAGGYGTGGALQTGRSRTRNAWPARGGPERTESREEKARTHGRGRGKTPPAPGWRGGRAGEAARRTPATPGGRAVAATKSATFPNRDSGSSAPQNKNPVEAADTGALLGDGRSLPRAPAGRFGVQTTVHRVASIPAASATANFVPVILRRVTVDGCRHGEQLLGSRMTSLVETGGFGSVASVRFLRVGGRRRVPRVERPLSPQSAALKGDDMFKTLVRQTRLMCQFRSGLIVLPVHFFGRSIPCAGEGCEACSYRSPRRLGYCALFTGGAMAEFYELCESAVCLTVEACNRAGAQHLVDAATGVSMHLLRPSTRNAWKLEGAKLDSGRGPVIGMAELLGRVARLYRLPLPLPGEDWQKWFERVRVDQNDLLRACLLPFGQSHRKVCG